MNSRTTQEKVLISLSALGFLSIFPFAISRAISSQWSLAALDASLSLTMLAVCLHVVFTRKIDRSSLFISLVSVFGSTLTVFLRGESHAYWVYPAVLATFYLLPPKTAFRITLIGLALVSFKLYSSSSLIVFSSIISTLLISLLFAYVFSKHMHEAHAAMAKLATTDSLTQAGNRRALETKLEQLMVSQSRLKNQQCLIIFDLDHFKKVNDQHGHGVGDQALIEVVKRIKQRIRISDSIYRFGGEEFVVVTVATPADQAMGLAEELRQLIEQIDFKENIRLTASFGVAAYREGESYHDWLNRADAALYQAKDAGRNQVKRSE